MEGHTIVRKKVQWPFVETTVIVVDDKLVSMTSTERMFQTSKRTLKDKLSGTSYITKLSNKVHDKQTGGYLQTFVTKKGIETFMRIYMNWKPENISTAMRMIFDAWNEEEDEEDEEEDVSIYVSDAAAAVTRHISPPPPRKKRTLEDKMDTFLDEMRFIVTSRTQMEYRQSAQFKEDCARAVNARVDQLMPEIREQLRRELEPEVRESIAKKMREDVVLDNNDKEKIPFDPDAYASRPEDFATPSVPVDWSRYGVVQRGRV